MVYALFQCEIHLVEGLCANLLIGNDITSSEAMVINSGKKTMLIGPYGVIINVNAKQRGQFLAKKLLTSQESVIPLCSEAMIPLVKLPLLDNRDFLFYRTPQANVTLYFYIMDYETTKILVRNTFDRPLCILCRHKLGHLLDMTYKNYFFMDTQSAYDAASILPSLHSFSNLSTEPILLAVDTLIETVLRNGIGCLGTLVP